MRRYVGEYGYLLHLASAVVYYAAAFLVMALSHPHHDWMAVGAEMTAVVLALTLAMTWRPKK